MGILGIDIGGSGIKGAIVDTETGDLLSDRLRLKTPQPATPENIANTVQELVEKFDYKGRTIGVSFPTVIMNGMVLTYGNIDPSWLGVQVDDLFKHKTGHEYIVHNDADLAGLAEMELGSGKDVKGTVITITIGTGIGSGLYYNGTLVPNVELGHIYGKDGKIIEKYVSDKAREANDLSWSEWGERFDFFLHHIVRAFSPNLFIIGGGASKKWEKYQDQLTVKTPIKVAQFLNNAGIIGAAMSTVHKF